MPRPLSFSAQIVACGFVLALTAALHAAAPSPSDSVSAERPNVIVILTDNHGAWTLGCYGNTDIRTPHIDRLAKEGTLFSRAYASNPVCSPTRATLLTGLLPSQHGVHCFLRGGRLQVGEQARSTLTDFRSMGEVMRDAGYRCGLVGKWHLGDNLRPQEGLDDEWITTPHGGTSTFYDAQVIENGKIRKEPGYLTDLWTDRSVAFIEKAEQDQRPFFLYLAYNGPYALGRLLLREPRNRHAEYYRGVEFTSFPNEGVHPWQFNNRDYIHQPVSMRRVAAEVSAVDDGVGAIVKKLEQLNLTKKTLIVFLADQGWVAGQGGFYGMGDHTRPVTARDGMMQIPMIWWHPDRVQPDQRAELMVANYDVLPSLLSYLNLELGDTPANYPDSPGRDFSPVLSRSASAVDWRDEVFYEFESLRCIRTKQWKYVHRHPDGPHELYDLKTDLEERFNLSDSKTAAGMRTKLEARLGAFFDQYASPKYDLWKGGESQTVRFVDAPRPPQLPALSSPAVKWEQGFQPAQLTVPKGLEVELVAGPPLVRYPMMGCFDDQGRLYLAESAGLNLRTAELEKQLPNFVRRLVDTDGDGIFDKSTIFADKITFPQGVLWHDGALYVASPPNIWKLEDTDEDGVADKRQILVDRFGYSGNGASVHGCFLAPDGRIYWCDGRHGHEFTDDEGNTISKREGSYIFSCRTDGSDVRVHCGGGMDNPVEVDFTESGEVIGTVNILYSRPRLDCLVHWLHGGTYPHSERVLGEFQRTGDLLGPIHKFGHVTVSGTTRYRSGWLDPNMVNNYFVTIFNTGKLQRVELSRDRGSFRAVEREFLTSQSKDFHPTDVLEDADGSLLLIDTGGWFRIGCPTSQIAKPEIAGGIYRIRRQGSASFLDPWGKNIRWPELTPRGLTALLNDTRFKVREKAISECAKRGDGIVSTLNSVLKRGDVRARLGAVWALSRIGSSAAQDAGRVALNDRDLDVRIAAIVSTGSSGDLGAAERLVAMLRDKAPAIRREAATSLGKLQYAAASAPILQSLRSPTDRTEEHALIFALIEINEPTQLFDALQSPTAAVQRGALWALDQMEKKTLTVNQVAPLLASESPQVREAAMRVFLRHTEWTGNVGQLLEQWLQGESPGDADNNLIAGFVTAFAGTDSVARVVGQHLTMDSPQTAVRLLESLGNADRIPLHESWSEPLNAWLHSDDTQVLATTLQAVASIQTDHFDKLLAELVADATKSASIRLAAVEAIMRHSPRPNAITFEFLISLLAEDASPQERTTSARILSNASLTSEQLRKLTDNLPFAGPLELQLLIQPYRRDVDKATSVAFLDALVDARSFSALAESDVSDVIKRYSQELLPRGNQLLEKLRQLNEEKRAQLDDLIPAIRSGVPARGKAVFFAEKNKCSTCHRVGDQGGQIGPDLTAIGRIRNERDLLESIVFPSASLAREFEPYTVLFNDGRLMSGIVVHETDDLLHIQQAEGKPQVIARADIESVVPTTISIMPQGLDKPISKQDLADLVAYLRSLNQ
ncbi:MAG: PVC-type heme-binding CxxCH protein [Pirellulaceae bacterium]